MFIFFEHPKQRGLCGVCGGRVLMPEILEARERSRLKKSAKQNLQPPIRCQCAQDPCRTQAAANTHLSLLSL